MFCCDKVDRFIVFLMLVFICWLKNFVFFIILLMLGFFKMEMMIIFNLIFIINGVCCWLGYFCFCCVWVCFSVVIRVFDSFKRFIVLFEEEYCWSWLRVILKYSFKVWYWCSLCKVWECVLVYVWCSMGFLWVSSIKVICKGWICVCLCLCVVLIVWCRICCVGSDKVFCIVVVLECIVVYFFELFFFCLKKVLVVIFIEEEFF